MTFFGIVLKSNWYGKVSSSDNPPFCLLISQIDDVGSPVKSFMDAFAHQTRHHLALFVERANGTFRYVVKINSGSDVQKHIFAGVFS